jgi:hypothetical protein
MHIGILRLFQQLWLSTAGQQEELLPESALMETLNI